MSSISLTPAVRIPVVAGPVAPASRTRLRITARGRRVLAALAALPVVVALAVAVHGSGMAAASSESGVTAEFTTVTAKPGDTLWSIATSVAPDADPRDVIDAIMRLNVIDGGAIEVGQRIAIPAAYAPAS